MHWLVQGYGYEITSADVWAAYAHTIKAAANAHGSDEIRRRIRALIDSSDARFLIRFRRAGPLQRELHPVLKIEFPDGQTCED